MTIVLNPFRHIILEQLHNTVGLADLLATDHDLPFGSLDDGSPHFNYNTTLQRTSNKDTVHCVQKPKVKLLGFHH